MELQDMLYTFHTKDGILIGVRHLRYDDAVYLVGIFENMNADSRYQRYHQIVDHIHAGRIWQEAETIAHMDAKKQDGLIAFADLPDNSNTPVGAARYVSSGDRRAETAVSIRDDMQGRGIGSELLGLLAEEARQNGIQQLVAELLNSNRGMMGVLKKLPYEITREIEGTYCVLTVHLDKFKEGYMRAERPFVALLVGAERRQTGAAGTARGETAAVS
jgi:acetyltransferase